MGATHCPRNNLPACEFTPALSERLAAFDHFGCDFDGCEVQSLLEVLYDTLGLEKEGDMVDGRDIMNADDLFGGDVTEHGDLGFSCWFQWFLYDNSARNLRRR